MSKRRILVIGSQCRALGNLPFLPQVAQDLYTVMTDPERGGCVSAIERDGLLINPTVRSSRPIVVPRRRKPPYSSLTSATAKGRATISTCCRRMRCTRPPTPTQQCTSSI
jgi:hypothetical protein